MSLTARSPWVGNIHGRFCVLSHVVSLVWSLLDAVVRDDFYAADLGGFGILGDYICSEITVVRHIRRVRGYHFEK